MPEQYSAERKRKRGIKASRVKLYKAMAKAGIKTQAALACKIADSENLDTPPKDIVSKIFREISVSPSSLERVADALGVEAYTLYLSRAQLSEEMTKPEFDEVKIDPISPKIHSNKQANFHLNKPVTLIFLIMVAIIGYIFYISLSHKTVSKESHYKFTNIKPALGTFSLVIATSPNFIEFTPELTEILSRTFHVSSEIIENVGDHNPEQLTYLKGKYQTDFILKLYFQQFGNFFKLNVSLQNNDQNHQIWASYNRTVSFSQNMSLYFQDIVQAIQYSVGLLSEYKSKYAKSPDETALKYYLQGRSLLDVSENELNITSAQSRFIRAIKLSSNFAEAHAGLCEALVHESWMSDEKALLEEAQKSCEIAMSIDSSNYYVMSSNSFLLTRTGRSNEAIALLTDFHTNNPKTFETLHSLANAEFDSYRHTPRETSILENAREHINEAISTAPNLWKPYQTLGLMEWTKGNTQEALTAFEMAVEKDATELVVVNTGALNLCLNNVSKAKAFFEKSMTMEPNSHLGLGRMGTLKYIQEKHVESLNLRKKVINKVKDEGIHQMWGALADSYEKTRSIELAIDAYLQALTLIERDILRGNFTPYDQASQYYYKTKLAYLDNTRFTLNEAEKLKGEELMGIAPDLDNASITKLAQVALFNQDIAKARELTNIAVANCPIYKAYPDLKSLYSAPNEL